MKISKQILSHLYARGWTLSEGEKWRYARGRNWACAYFNYKQKTCLITVALVKTKYYIQILYAHPACSTYVYDSIKKQFDIKL